MSLIDPHSFLDDLISPNEIYYYLGCYSSDTFDNTHILLHNVASNRFNKNISYWIVDALYQGGLIVNKEDKILIYDFYGSDNITCINIRPPKFSVDFLSLLLHHILKSRITYTMIE
jgi:hypothetical protein